MLSIEDRHDSKVDEHNHNRECQDSVGIKLADIMLSQTRVISSYTLNGPTGSVQ